MKEGAEDLWNERDGPVKSQPLIGKRGIHAPIKSQPLIGNRQIRTPIDIRKLVSGENGCEDPVNSNSGLKSRSYSVYSGNLNDGFKRKSVNLNDPRCSVYTRCVSSMNLNDGVKPRQYCAYLVDSNDGFKLKHCSFLSKSVKPMNLNDGIKPRDCSCYSMNLNDGIRLWHCPVYSLNLNDGIKPRHYSAYVKSRMRSRLNFSDNSSDDDESEDEEKEGERKGSERRFMSSAALGKYDKKTTRRVPLKFLDKEEDLSKQVEAIRNEVENRKMVRNVVDKSDEDSVLSQKRFDECNVSPLTVKALTQAGYVQMTKVQEATLSVCLEGNDALVKAKTGTGKSAAFLLPAIETVLKASSSNKRARVPPVYVLILCPTRELASQIAAETNVMLKYHEGIGVQTLVGGTRFKVDQKRLELDPCQIMVATPGRLLDHIESKSGLSVRLMGLKMLILDEADHLLDLGFRKDMEKIVDCLPRERQSLLFSATIPKEVRRISQLVLKRDHAYIDTVGLGCVETPTKVKQFKLVVPHDQHFQMVYHLLNEHIKQTPDYKVIVFCTTAMVTSLMFLLLREFKMNVREIHSRKPQLYRTRISEEFKEAKRQILISSDVSARGMNYPDVTLVIQVGTPSDREQYIHRLGRTGREGKEGEGILLLAPWEEYFLDDIKDLPIANFPVPQLDPELQAKVGQSMANIDSSVREAAYHAWLGYYNSIGEIGRDKTTLAELANQFSQSIGLEKPPSLFRKTAVKMGLRNITGIRIRK